MKARFLSILFLFPLLVSTGGSVSVWGGDPISSGLDGSLNFRGSQAEWQRVNPQGEEFSILTPVTPTLFKQGGDYTTSGSREKVLDRRSYGGYIHGFIFYIESYKADRPKNLVEALDKDRYPQRVFDSDIKVSGFAGKQYRTNYQSSYVKYFTFVTKRHIYFITLASMDENNAFVERFISSLTLGDNLTEPATGQVSDVRDSPLYQSAISGESDTNRPRGEVYRSKDLSRKARIVTRPEPTYTDEARRKRVAGTVVLEGVFGADGQVRIIRVKQGLEAGLTGKAIEAALAIRYFPAEKDGQLVSQIVQIEYNFNLY